MSQTQERFLAFIRQQIDQNNGQDWHRPCAVMVHPASTVGAAVYERIKGHPLPDVSAELGNDYAAGVFLPSEQLAPILTELAGPGGAFVARQLLEESAPVHYWLIVLFPEEIDFAGFTAEGLKVFSASQSYAEVGRGRQTLGEMVNDEGPSRLCLETDDGEQVAVYGRTGIDAALAGNLVATVRSGSLTAEYQGKLATVPCDDEMLTTLLSQAYSGENGPHQIAEAVTALKKLPGAKHTRLLRLLRNRPALQQLWARVREELTGEAA